MKYYLRHTSSADRDFLQRLKKACLKEYVEAIWGWDEADQRRRFIASFDPSASQVVVAFGRDVGQLAIEVRRAGIFLSGIYLLPAYQGRGLGSLILNDLLNLARQHQQPVQLQVLVNNPARNLYERLGFRITGKTDTHFMMRRP